MGKGYSYDEIVKRNLAEKVSQKRNQLIKNGDKN